MPQKNVSILFHVLHLLYDFWFMVKISTPRSTRMCEQGTPTMKKSQDKNVGCFKLAKGKGKSLLFMMTDEIFEENKNSSSNNR